MKSSLVVCFLLLAIIGQLSFVTCQKAICHLVGTDNDPTVTGTVTFTPNGDEVEVTVNINGITQNPDAAHGIHIHEYGDISDQVAASEVGAHWNPEGEEHGCPPNDTRHYGDMGNWNVTGGEVSMSKVLDLIKLVGDSSVVGHAVVLHNETDNCKTVASSGARLAQCVIGIANEAGNTAVNGLTDVVKAVADLWPTTGNTPNGRVIFTQATPTSAVNVKASIWNMTGIHGFHIHEFGDITSATGANTGNHYNPLGSAHSIPPNTPRHIGDMGNIYYYEDGVAYYEYDNDAITLNGANSVVGRALIIHGEMDDCGQPYGNAGPKVAQAVIGLAAGDVAIVDFPADVPTAQNVSECVTPTTEMTDETSPEGSSVARLVGSFFLLLAALMTTF